MNLNDYEMFVDNKTSAPSKDIDVFVERINELQVNADDIGVELMQLITASTGLPAEAGEFTEIVKKVLFQGKPLDEATKFHLKRELGDIMFYWAMSCTALGYTPQEIIDENVDKLKARYKEGFTEDESNNREDGDL